MFADFLMLYLWKSAHSSIPCYWRHRNTLKSKMAWLMNLGDITVTWSNSSQVGGKDFTRSLLHPEIDAGLQRLPPLPSGHFLPELQVGGPSHGGEISLWLTMKGQNLRIVGRFWPFIVGHSDISPLRTMRHFGGPRLWSCFRAPNNPLPKRPSPQSFQNQFVLLDNFPAQPGDTGH